jgi:hypothetical protein
MTRILPISFLPILLSAVAVAQPAPPPEDAAPPPGYAAPPPGYGAPAPYPYPRRPAPGAETHDGAYVRLQLGGGYTSLSADADGNSLKISGASVGFGLAVGGAIAPDLIIYGTVIDSLASSPTVKVNGVSGTLNNDSAGVVGLGPGIAYYMQPSNVFLAGSLLISRLVVQDSNGNKVGESDWGVTLEALLGKEWWVSDNLGLGLSGQFLLGRMKDKSALTTGGSVPNWQALAFSLLFSATYN